jgi:flagellar hook-associated protein 3 FlgL
MGLVNTPFVSSSFSRVSSVLSRNVILGNLRMQQEELLRVQEQLATGFRIVRPSDDPVGANRVMDFTLRIERNTQFIRNIDTGMSRLTMSDVAINDTTELLNRAKEILLTQVQSTADAQSRRLAAQELSQIISQAMDLGNTNFEDRYLFAGSRADRAPFLGVGGAVAFTGNTDDFFANISARLAVATNISADESFGVFSDEFLGRDPTTLSPIDLDPALILSTRLSSLNGGSGIAKGSIEITGSVGTAVVDLQIAETISDVIDLINQKTATTGLTAAINAAVDGLVLTDIGAGPIVVQEVQNGITARDLQILTAPVGVGSPHVGGDLDPVVTLRTQLGDLFRGVGIDSTGMTLTNDTAAQTYSATFTSTVFNLNNTVEQVLNALNGANLFVEARISDTRTGIDIVSKLSGARLLVTENGGNTARDLGLLSTVARAKVENLNGGLGVGSVDGSDMQITLKDGTMHFVDVDNVSTVFDLATALNNLSGLNATLNASDGITLTDATGGAGALTVENFNGSFAATNLNIEGTTPGAVISGTALTYVGEQVEGIFTALINIRDALLQDDVDALNVAGRLLDRVREKLLSSRSGVGTRLSNLELASNRLDFELTELERFRSETRNVDLAEAATRFQIQETVLQASLSVAGRILQTSIFNFL